MSSSAINTQVAQLKIGNVQNQADNSGVYSAGVWSFKNSTALTSVTITDAGNVGIGTSSPIQKLHVNGGIVRIDSTNILFLNPNYDNGNSIAIQGFSNVPLVFTTNNTERMRIDASGRVGVNLTSLGNNEQFSIKGYPSGYALTVYPTTGGVVAQIETENTGTTPGISGTLRLAKNASTSRSINASGTINANGADYAEYMLKAGDFTIVKGEICGITSEGKLTKTFSEAVAFVVKSTNPSYVGNDNWFTEQRPCDEDEKELLKDSKEFKAWESRMEAARQLVDRIAFCGQVPVNVLGAAPGQWIIPVEDNGGIKGEAVSSPSFEQYQKAVGKVIAVEEDGRARIIVKIA